MGQRVGIYGAFHLIAGGVRIDFCGAQIGMAQNVLEHPDIHIAVAVH